MPRNKKGKKYDPAANILKRQIARDKKQLETLAIAYVAKGESEPYHAVLIDLAGNQVSLSKSMADLISRHHYKWSVYMSVFGFDGTKYSKSESLLCDEHINQSELVEYLNDKHQAMIKNFNPLHLCGAGWIAQPSGYDFSETDAGYIFYKLGAWEHVNTK